MTTFRFTVLTPLATVLEWDVESVIVPLADGWRGLLPGHAPFEACLMTGEVLVRTDGRERLLATLGGALTVAPEGVVVSTGAAVLDTPLQELEREIGDEARRRAALEHEAEKQFDRVYREMARTLNSRRRRRA
jgi:F-type H+-transporting ATPase subunit epsilon